MHPCRRTALAAFMLLTSVSAVALPSVAAADDASRPTGRLLVTVRPGNPSPAATTSSVDAALTAAGSRARATQAVGTTAAVPVPGAASRTATTKALERDPRITGVIEEERAVPRSLPDDPVLRDQDSLAPAGTTQAWWARKMRLPQAWDLANGAGTTIAVIDTGFDLTHPQLKPIVDEALTSYVPGDDTPRPGTARTDENGHGTHVASLACSAFNDGSGTVGAGGRCHLITFKSDLYDLSVARAVRRATALGVDAIVMSFGTDGERPASKAQQDALKAAAAKGVVLVTAAADVPTTEQGWPANVLQPTGTGSDRDAGIGLTVTAATNAGVRASFAGSGSQISLAAFGTYGESGAPPGIIGAFPATRQSFEDLVGNGIPLATRTNVRGDSRYAYEQGTSFAAPMVAGVAALMRSANPDLGAPAIARILKTSATRSAGWTPALGWGIVDAQRAVDRARRVDLRAPAATFSSRSRTISGSRATLSWRGTDRSPKPLVPSGVRTVELWRSVDGGKYAFVGSGRRGLAVRVPEGEVRYTLRAVDRAGNRARLSSKGAITLSRR